MRLVKEIVGSSIINLEGSIRFTCHDLWYSRSSEPSHYRASDLLMHPSVSASKDAVKG